MEPGGVDSIQGLAPAKIDQDTDKNAKERLEKEKKLKKACADFESIFIYHMLKKMRSTVPKSALVNGMTGKDTYQMMMDQKVSEELSNKGGLGLQKMLSNQIKMEDKNSGSSTEPPRSKPQGI
jgi:peptidoglycan hydrolase FlgJ